MLQAPRLELSGPGYDLLPFELETAQPSRIKVHSGEPNMHEDQKIMPLGVMVKASVLRSSMGYICMLNPVCANLEPSARDQCSHSVNAASCIDRMPR